jgi:hypothetical protein
MADFSAVKGYLNSQNLHYFTFVPKSLKLIKAVIRHLSGNKPAEEIYEGLVELGFDIVSVKQMSTTRRSQDQKSKNLPLFLITLPRSEKSLEIFKLTSLRYISIKVEAYKSQSGLTQCHNCKQPPHCLWWGGAATSTGNARKRIRMNLHRFAAIVSWRMGRNPTQLTTEAAATRRIRCVGGEVRWHPSKIMEGPSLPNTSSQECPAR